MFEWGHCSHNLGTNYHQNYHQQVLLLDCQRSYRDHHQEQSTYESYRYM